MSLREVPARAESQSAAFSKEGEPRPSSPISPAGDAPVAGSETKNDSVEETRSDAKIEDPRRAHIKADLVVMGNLGADSIIDLMDRSQSRLSICHEKEIEAGRLANGRLIVRLLISPLGRVVEAGMDRKLSTVEDQELEKCVLGIVRGTVFPEPKGGASVEVYYPFNFPLEKLDLK